MRWNRIPISAARRLRLLLPGWPRSPCTAPARRRVSKRGFLSHLHALDARQQRRCAGRSQGHRAELALSAAARRHVDPADAALPFAFLSQLLREQLRGRGSEFGRWPIFAAWSGRSRARHEDSISTRNSSTSPTTILGSVGVGILNRPYSDFLIFHGPNNTQPRIRRLQYHHRAPAFRRAQNGITTVNLNSPKVRAWATSYLLGWVDPNRDGDF